MCSNKIQIVSDFESYSSFVGYLTDHLRWRYQIAIVSFLLQIGNKMGGINIRFSMSMIIAIVAVEIMNTLFFTHYTPWYHYIGHRYLFTAIICDAIVVVILKYIKDNKWTIRKWEDAATLSLWIALLYAGFHAPYVVYDPFTGSHFILTVFHKFSDLYKIALGPPVYTVKYNKLKET
ncbi:unnamed protein product [Mytilus coruscus]|uniref:Uncharacterized protein n=1 Tax=Mytilus coruscus TaxID=42192 RepID=A0A6J8BX65_MYTCO|nr:unnamed protein product [Mytilus coruscus]